MLEAEPELFQVAINYTDADQLTGASAPEHAVRRALDTGRYVPTEVVAHGPAMFDTARLDRAGGWIRSPNSDAAPPPPGCAPPPSMRCSASNRTNSQPIAGYDLAVSDPPGVRPAICLNMIVRNEAHIVTEVLDAVAPYISTWVIVDTGSDDAPNT